MISSFGKKPWSSVVHRGQGFYPQHRILDGCNQDRKLLHSKKNSKIKEAKYGTSKKKLQLNLCKTTTLGAPKNGPLLERWSLFKGRPIKLVNFLVGWGSGWLFFTGCCCSEVVVNTNPTLGT